MLPAGVRVDAGVEEGDEIGLSYDPMIAKLIAHGADRDEALSQLELALDETVVEGVTTNLPFLRWLVRHPAFRRAPSRPRSCSTTRRSRRAARGRTGRVRARVAAERPSPAPTPAPDVDAAVPAGLARDGTIAAPMPGTVIAVPVAVGDRSPPTSRSSCSRR